MFLDDSTRVILQTLPGMGTDDYINATYVDVSIGCFFKFHFVVGVEESIVKNVRFKQLIRNP
jgi:hypothetical protein